MKKTLYADDTFEVIEASEGNVTAKYVHYVPSEGNFVAVLPFKKVFNQYRFLVKRELILGWDGHPDHCAISCPLKYQPQVSAAHALKEISDVKVEQKDFFQLGICTASVLADDTYYLFAIDLTKFDEAFENDKLEWVDEEKLMTSNDSQLITLYARFKYLY